MSRGSSTSRSYIQRRLWLQATFRSSSSKGRSEPDIQRGQWSTQESPSSWIRSRPRNDPSTTVLWSAHSDGCQATAGALGELPTLTVVPGALVQPIDSTRRDVLSTNRTAAGHPELHRFKCEDRPLNRPTFSPNQSALTLPGWSRQVSLSARRGPVSRTDRNNEDRVRGGRRPLDAARNAQVSGSNPLSGSSRAAPRGRKTVALIRECGASTNRACGLATLAICSGSATMRPRRDGEGSVAGGRTGVLDTVAPPMAIVAGHFDPDRPRWRGGHGRRGRWPAHGIGLPDLRGRPRLRRRGVRHSSPHPRSPGSPKSARQRWVSAPTTANPRVRVGTRSTPRTSVWWFSPPREDRLSTSCRAACRIHRTPTRWWPRTPSNKTRAYTLGASSMCPSTPRRKLSAYNSATGTPPKPTGPTVALRVVGFEATEFDFPSGSTPSYSLYASQAFGRSVLPRWRRATCTSSASIGAQPTFPDSTLPPAPWGGRPTRRTRIPRSHRSKRRFIPKPSGGGSWLPWPLSSAWS